MRHIRFCVLVGLLAWLLLPAEGNSQLPSGGSPSGRMSFGDPSQLWDKISGGKESITRESVSNPFFQGMFDRIVQQLGITDGKVTRDHFTTYMQQRTAAKASGEPSGFTKSSGTGGGPPGTGPTAPGQPGGGGFSPDMMDQWAERSFRRYDHNGDGLLNYDEMPEALRIERDKWDANKDGFIDLNEFKGYFKGMVQQRMAEGSFGMMGSGAPAGQSDPEPVEEEAPKPVVYRAGKLPKELPAWFKQIDTDGDGQVSLYEWRSAGRPIDEFQKMDRNGDGFLTIAEVLYLTTGRNNLNGVAIVANTPKPNGDDVKTAPTGAPTVSIPGAGGGTRPSFSKGGDGKTSEGKSGKDKGSWGGKTR